MQPSWNVPRVDHTDYIESALLCEAITIGILREQMLADHPGEQVEISVPRTLPKSLLTLASNDTIIAGAANITLVYFVLALLVERTCEVVMDLLTAVGVVAAKDGAVQGSNQPERRMVSIFGCLVFAIVISLSGLRLVEMILEVATKSDVQSKGYFAAVDTLLTSLILAGGSDGIHQIIRSLLGEKSPLPENG